MKIKVYVVQMFRNDGYKGSENKSDYLVDTKVFEGYCEACEQAMFYAGNQKQIKGDVTHFGICTKTATVTPFTV